MRTVIALVAALASLSGLAACDKTAVSSPAAVSASSAAAPARPEAHPAGAAVQPGQKKEPGLPKSYALLYRWHAGKNEVVGEVPADTFFDLDGAVGTAGILVWREGEVVGGYLSRQPWLIRPGQPGVSLGETDVYPYAEPRWSGRESLLVLNHGHRLLMFDASGKSHRSLVPAPEHQLLNLSVNPWNGKMAVVLVPVQALERSDSPPLHLLVLSPSGDRLAKLENIEKAKYSEGPLYISSTPLHWLPDGRLAFTRQSGKEPPPGKAPPLATLLLADPASNKVISTGVTGHGIYGVTDEGEILWSDGRLYHPVSGKIRKLALPPGYDDLYPGRLSPDMTMIAESARDSPEAEPWRVWVVHLATGMEQTIGNGRFIGWAPDGALFWAEMREPNGEDEQPL